MTAFSESFRLEVARIARKENKGELTSLRKTATGQRGEIAALKRDVKELVGQVRSLTRALQKALVATEHLQVGVRAGHAPPGAARARARSAQDGCARSPQADRRMSMR